MKWMILGKDDIKEVQGGLNRYVFGLAGSMSDLGEDVEILIAGPSANDMVGSRITGNSIVRIFRFFTEGWKKGISGLDVVNVHFAMYGAPFLAGQSLRRLAGRGLLRSSSRPVVIYNFHGPWAAESFVARKSSGPAYLVKRFMEQYCLQRADRVVVLSQEFAGKVTESFTIAQDSVRRIPPGVDEAWFNRGPASDNAEDTTLLRLVCVRRLTPRMGHLELLQSLEELDFRIGSASVELNIVGKGESDREIRAWIDSNQRAKNVIVHGFMEDEGLRALMWNCQGAVIPTTQLEGFGLVVLEAMAMGLPVVSTGQGGLSEAMGPWGKPPFIFSIDDAQSLSRSLNAVCELRRDSESLASLVHYAKSHEWAATARSVRAVALEVTA